jgi:hypothetical protein
MILTMMGLSQYTCSSCTMPMRKPVEIPDYTHQWIPNQCMDCKRGFCQICVGLGDGLTAEGPHLCWSAVYYVCRDCLAIASRWSLKDTSKLSADARALSTSVV